MQALKRILILTAVFLLFAIVFRLSFLYLSQTSMESTPALEVQSSFGDVLLISSAGIHPLQHGERIQMGDKIRTGKEGEIELHQEGKSKFRIKQNSEIELKRNGTLFLKHGALLGVLKEDEIFKVEAKGWQAKMQNASFYAEADEKKSTIGILNGEAQIKKGLWGAGTALGSLQKVESNSSIVKKISRDEWNRMKETYELIQKSAASEALQMDLSKQAGDMFNFVFDHGTFYTPKMGFADREFIKDASTGDVRLEISYDVFPVGCYVGMYLKTRDLDLLNYESLHLKAKRPDEGTFPQQIRIEMKSKTGIARVFVIKNFSGKWSEFEFPFSAQKSIPINEITIMMTHEKVGSDKSGKFLLRDFSLKPKEKSESKISAVVQEEPPTKKVAEVVAKPVV